MKTAIEVMRQLDINPKGLGITGKDAAIKIILEQTDKGVRRTTKEGNDLQLFHG